MTRAGKLGKLGIDFVDVRWRIPKQLWADFNTVARYTSWGQGELATLALQEFLAKYVPKWNERMAVRIPELPSLQRERKPFTIHDFLRELESIS